MATHPSPERPASDCATHRDESEETVITSIQVTDVALGLRRVPTAFYIVVLHSGLEWRTENKPSVNDNVIEWDGPIPILEDLSATVCIEVYASFEFQSMVVGERLQEFSTTAEDLLGRSAKHLPVFSLSPKDGDVISPCSSILITVEQRKCGNSDSSTSRVLGPHRSTIESQDELEDTTNKGNISLSPYRRHGQKHLERSIEEFERALSVCPLDHPCRAAAQLNLAIAKFILSQVEDTDDSLEVPLGLYSDALQLAAVHFTRLTKQRDEAAGARARSLLNEATTESPDQRAAAFMLQSHTGRRVGPVQADVQLSVENNSAVRLQEEDPCILSGQLLDRFQRFGDSVDLQRAITLLEDFVRSTLVSDHRYLAGLANLGVALYHRFRRFEELDDLEEAISRWRGAVDLTPDGHPEKPRCLHDLGNAFLARFQHLGNLSDLEDAISTLRDAVDLIPHDHPRKLDCVNNLGSALFDRFQRVGNISNLEDAISTFRDAVDLTPHGHPRKPSHLNNLASAFLVRFLRHGELSDLENGISTLTDVVDLTPHGHPDKLDHLNNLGHAILDRFKRVGNLSDLQDAISTLTNAVDLTPQGHPHKPGYLNNLGNAFSARFKRLGEPSDLEDAISIYSDAVDLTPPGHPDKPGRLSNLGSAFGARFKRLGELSDLEDAISRYRNAVDGHPDKLDCLNNLGNAFLIRFQHLGELSDLKDAIAAYRDAVALTPHGHPRKPTCLNTLGTAFSARFDRLGELSDLENAILTFKDAVDLTPHDHPDKPGHLNDLSIAFLTRFERLGELSDLEDCISRQRDAADLTPHDHPDKPGRLSNLGNAFSARFKRHGNLCDLQDGISMYRDAVALTPHGHPHKPVYLNNLGTAFSAHFERLGELSDLEDAILRYRDAVDLTPRGHPDKLKRLINLGSALLTRFLHLGELSDLEDAISTYSVDLPPHGHPDEPGCLSNLGNAFLTRFHRLGELSDLEKAIATLSNAVTHTPHGHPQKSNCLNNLGIAFFTRFQRLGELNNLEDAILRYRDAVDLLPKDHPERPRRLSNLGDTFGARFKRLGELSDLEDAILTCRDAVDLTPDGHPDKSRCLNYLGHYLTARFERFRDPTDFEQTISLYSRAASASTAPIRQRFRASQHWILCAQRMHHCSLFHAYSVAISLLPQLAWVGLELRHRYDELAQGADVVREAAAAALDSGLPETAVEWLEQGRSVVWGELFQLRSSYEELSVVHADHARRLQELSAALENASITREKSSVLSEQASAARRATESLQQEADNHRALAIARDKLLKEIRGLPGFERFLLHKEFSQLRASAHSGPVVILNAAESRCDALIVLADVDHVIHVPLPTFTFQRSSGLQNMLEKLLGHARDIHSDDRKGDPATLRGVSWESLLSTLWNGVVKPVLDALAFSTPGDLSRIFWCPTGPFVFLPIHAAGLYGTQQSQPGHKVSDFVISSYVPTLAILSLSPNSSAVPSGTLRLLAVRQPSSDGLPHLSGVAVELEHIREIIRNFPWAQTTLLESSVGTVEEVLDLMKDADWVHFACHGIQDGADSGLCLANGRRLKVSDIIALSRPHGGLAFLSACQTAMGDERLSDEAIHVAAGMLFAGYGGVIGTMWSISDQLAPHVAWDVYTQLFRNGTRPDCREAARALHDAIGRLRDRRNVPFHIWLPFIHVGL